MINIQPVNLPVNDEQAMTKTSNNSFTGDGFAMILNLLGQENNQQESPREDALPYLSEAGEKMLAIMPGIDENILKLFFNQASPEDAVNNHGPDGRNSADQNVADQNIADQNIADQNIADQKMMDAADILALLEALGIRTGNIAAKPGHDQAPEDLPRGLAGDLTVRDLIKALENNLANLRALPGANHLPPGAGKDFLVPGTPPGSLTENAGPGELLSNQAAHTSTDAKGLQAGSAGENDGENAAFLSKSSLKSPLSSQVLSSLDKDLADKNLIKNRNSYLNNMIRSENIAKPENKAQPFLPAAKNDHVLAKAELEALLARLGNAGEHKNASVAGQPGPAAAASHDVKSSFAARSGLDSEQPALPENKNHNHFTVRLENTRPGGLIQAQASAKGTAAYKIDLQQEGLPARQASMADSKAVFSALSNQQGSPAPNTASQPVQLAARVAPFIHQAVSNNQGTTSLRIKLIPEHLGEISVRLIYKQGNLQAHFIAANGQTRELIEQSMVHLRENLSQLNINLHDASTSSGDEGDKWTQQNDFQQRRSPAKEFKERLNQAGETKAEETAERERQDRGLDHLV